MKLTMDKGVWGLVDAIKVDIHIIRTNAPCESTEIGIKDKSKRNNLAWQEIEVAQSKYNAVLPPVQAHEINIE